MRRMMIALAVLATTTDAVPRLAAPSGGEALAQVVQERQKTTGQQSPRVRQPRYVCFIRPPASDKDNSFYSCPARPGRVGESCRCPNTVGSGRLSQY